MTRFLSNRILLTAAAIASVSAACNGASSPAADEAAADQLTAAWVKAVDSGDAAAVAELYTEDAQSLPPGGPAIAGRTAIETYWREDFGSGGIVTKLTPGNSIAQADLLHVNGTYEVSSKSSAATLASGQYQQLWKREDGDWKVHDEIWRLDPVLQRDPKTAERLTSLWTAAYNAADAPALMALYDENAELATQPTGSVVGREAIGAFWKDDFGDGQSATTLTLTDVYVAGDLAHLEGQYRVSDKGAATDGRYVQLWMRDGNDWRIHREMWWR